MKSLKIAGLMAALALSTSAYAVQKDITVVADIDPTLELLQPDGSALPQTVRLNYIPGVGLQSQSIQTKIFTNDVHKAVTMRLVNNPVMAPMSNPSATGIALAVKYNNQALNTASALTTITLQPADMFPTIPSGSTATPGSSMSMPLTIGPMTVSPTVAAGSYQGVVSLVLTQSTATP